MDGFAWYVMVWGHFKQYLYTIPIRKPRYSALYLFMLGCFASWFPDSERPAVNMLSFQHAIQKCSWGVATKEFNAFLGGIFISSSLFSACLSEPESNEFKMMMNIVQTKGNSHLSGADESLSVRAVPLHLFFICLFLNSPSLSII